MKKLVVIIVLFFLVVNLGSIVFAEDESILRAALTYDSKTFDPANARSVSAAQTMNNIFSRLVDYEFGGANLVGDVAKNWNVSDDGMVYTFYLRKGIKFQKNFGELTSDDVKFTFDRFKDPDLVSSEKHFYNDLDHIEIVDDYTVKFVMANKNPAFLHILARASSSILSRKAVAEFGDKMAHNPVGSGPFEFVSWSPQDKTVLKAFDDYYKGRAKIDKVELIPIPDPSTLNSAFQSGDVDIIQVTDPMWYKKYDSDSNYKIDQEAATNTRFIGFNTQIKPFDNVKVRKAMQYGFNKKSLLENVLPGISTPATGPFASNTIGYNSDVVKYKYDPEKAKKLLAEAGYEDGFTTTIYVPNIDRFTTPAQIFQSDMKKIGVKINVQIMETSSMLDKAARGETPIFSLSRGHTPLPVRLAYSWFHPDNIYSGGNYGGYNNSLVTNLINELRDSTNEEIIAKLLGEIQKEVVDDAVYLYIDYEDNIYAMQDYVSGFQSDPFRSLRLYKTKIDKK